MSEYRDRTNRIIRAMCSAGYKRSEFKVHTPVSTWGDHGETEIIVNASIERQGELLVPVLNTGEIDIVKYIKTKEDGERHWWYYYCATYNRPDRYTVRDIDKENEELEQQIFQQDFNRKLTDAAPHLLSLVEELSHGIQQGWGYGSPDQTLSIKAKKLLRHYKLSKEDQDNERQNIKSICNNKTESK